ncbi:MAG TPA: ABC transporter permease [Azospirillaceae bacterium]|nr:ABC transporter permease [Azospirillaceae bacterium]
MIAFAGRRLLLLVVTVVAATLLIFTLSASLPGDPGRLLLGPFAPQDAVDRMNVRLGADRPLAVRYVVWLGDMLRGDWGRSYTFEQPVLALVLERLRTSASLAGTAVAVLVPVTVGASLLAASRPGGVFDRAVGLAALAIGALPEFVTGVLLAAVFGLWLGLLPVQGGAGPAGLVLPVATLVLLLFGYLFRVLRAGLVEAAASEYARTAAFKGLSPAAVLLRHALPNAAPPALAVLGAQIGWLVGGLVVVETLFQVPGLGALLLAAATHKDLPLLVGGTVAVTLAFAVGNFLADLAHTSLDPRLRHAGHGG